MSNITYSDKTFINPSLNTGTKLESKVKKGNPIILIFLIISVVLLLAGIAAIVYVFVNKPIQGVKCEGDNQCDPTQVCAKGFCSAKTCGSNIDCKGGTFCVNSYCTRQVCSNNTDCVNPLDTNDIFACVFEPTATNGYCTKVGGECTSDNDCWGQNVSLFCSKDESKPEEKGVCKQCKNIEDCKRTGNGGDCSSSGICYKNCNAVIGYNNQIGENPQPKLACGEGNYCTNNGTCCPTTFGDRNNEKECKSSTECGNGGYCVNGRCGCAKGDYGEFCTGNTDCKSGNCIAPNSSGGGICGNKGDMCFKNYDGVSNEKYYCGRDAPYCSFGRCSSNPVNSPCSFNTYQTGEDNNDTGANIYNSCNAPPGAIITESAGDTGSNGSNQPSNPALFCVFGYCRKTPGYLGAICTDIKDCSNGLVCAQLDDTISRCVTEQMLL